MEEDGTAPVREAAAAPATTESRPTVADEDGTLHVANVSPNVTAGHLRAIFGRYGAVAAVKLLPPTLPSPSPPLAAGSSAGASTAAAITTRRVAPAGSAHVTFASALHAERALAGMDGVRAAPWCRVQ